MILTVTTGANWAAPSQTVNSATTANVTITHLEWRSDPPSDDGCAGVREPRFPVPEAPATGEALVA